MPSETVSDERLAQFTTPSSQTRGPTMQECIDMARELQSLRSKPVASGVEVKSLTWRDTSEETLSRFQVASVANAPVVNFSYEIYRNTDGTFEVVFPGSLGKPLETFEEAKAAAQADYETRIRSALVYQPAPKGVEITPIMVERAWLDAQSWPTPISRSMIRRTLEAAMKEDSNG